MSTISALPADIVRWLGSQQKLQHITFLTEYPAVKKAIPLKKVIVAVGLEAVALEDKFVDDGNGILVEQEYCRTANLKITLAIHVPFSMGGHTCHDVFSDVVDALTFASDLNIESSGCGHITSDRDTDALVLTGFLQISSDFCPAASSGMHFASFLDKELLCGTHIRDENIHVSTEDRSRWDHPISVSSYLGNGQRTNTVNLGYRPSYVCLFAQDFPTMEYDPSTGRTNLYTAYGVYGGGTAGITITDTGFRVENASTDYDSCVPYLNMNGTRYRFFSLR